MTNPIIPLEISKNDTNLFDYDLTDTLDDTNVEDLSERAYRVRNDDDDTTSTTKHLYVLPVILLEFLALAFTRAVVPSMLLQEFGDNIYLIMGAVDFVRGMLAFIACPLFGTCSPVCIIALLPYGENYNNDGKVSSLYNNVTDGSISEPSVIPEGEDWTTSLEGAVDISDGSSSQPLNRIVIFVCLLALSGIFSSTFTLTFAYISDVVKARHQRVSAFGLALATFGLSFTVGPIAGGYIARSGSQQQNPNSTISSDEIGKQNVFTFALILTIIDLLYIYFILPESLPRNKKDSSTDNNTKKHIWSPMDTIKIFNSNPLLIRVSHIAFLYYTSLWAVISTMILYATKRFALTPDRLGELISAFGFSTMLSEAIIVRFVVPVIGEKSSMKLGLVAFMLQCIVLAFAYKPWHLFLCVALSTIGNLVYPSLTSLVSASVPPQTLGEVLGAINGIKALTEGIGPLFFGTLMTISENSLLPGWPYLVASIFSFLAYRLSFALPDENNEDYTIDKFLAFAKKKNSNRKYYRDDMDDKDSEICGLLDKNDDDEI